MSFCDGMNAMAIYIAWNLNHQIIREVRDRAMIWHIDGPHFLTVVEYRIHHVDRELELMDSAT